MPTIIRCASILLLSITTAGCIAPGIGPIEPAGVSNELRNQIHRLAVRDPTQPKASLTSDLDGKGKATGKSARDAGLLWLGGTMEAAGDAGEAAPLVLAVGIVTTPIAVLGGAIYGASAADTREAIEVGNRTLTGVLDFSPMRFRHALESSFVTHAPVAYEFIGNMSDQELISRGFDSVLDLRMDSLTGAPSENGFHTYFHYALRAKLSVLTKPGLGESRFYEDELSSKAVSDWAKDGGRVLLSELDESYAEIADDIVNDFFLRKAIRVQGMEPVSKGWSTGKISGRLPMFVWSARDGERGAPTTGVDYEVLVYSGRNAPETGFRTPATRYVPDELLEACTSYKWQVRAHYESFGQPAQSDWTPVYRFRTPCEKRKRQS